MKLEDILKTEQLSLTFFVVLDALEIPKSTVSPEMGPVRRLKSMPSLDTGIITDTHLLLFVHLSSVHQLFDGACTQQPKHLDITRLTDSESSVDGL